MEPTTFTSPGDVEAALLHEGLAPPPPPDTLHPGPTADLRNAMARFSEGDTHVVKRETVNRAIAVISHGRLTQDARQRTTSILNRTSATRVVDAASDIGFVAAVDTVAAALGMPGQDLDAARADVKAIVEVVGRQQPSSPESDVATTRLMSRFEGMGHDGVAAVSLLYQSHDACAGLFASKLLADQTGQRRRPSVAETARTATTELAIEANKIQRGATVVIDLESAPFEFGLGAHRCPGREVAERIVVGMVDAVCNAGFEIDIDEIEWFGDGRPRILPLRIRSGRS